MPVPRPPFVSRRAGAAFSYGAGSEATAEVESGALRARGRTGSTFTGAGTELALGTPNETADLSAFDGVEVEIDVAEGPVAVQFLSSVASRVDLPSAEVGETEGRGTLRLLWSAFGQRAPTPGWEANASASQVLVRGQGEITTAFTLHDLRLYRDGATP